MSYVLAALFMIMDVPDRTTRQDVWIELWNDDIYYTNFLGYEYFMYQKGLVRIHVSGTRRPRNSAKLEFDMNNNDSHFNIHYVIVLLARY